MKEILEDVLSPGMSVIFCGSAVGTASARRGAYYAGPGNKFWETLFKVGLTPTQLKPEQYRNVAALAIGFTDVAKTISGNDNILRRVHFGADALRRKIEKFSPKIVAFTSKRAAKEFLGRPVQYGLLQEQVGQSQLFVLPSPSGAACRWWKIKFWHELATLVRDATPHKPLKKRSCVKRMTS